ncbi:MAG: hypothetical protein CL833_02505 [Crocinitomicaceae bacterium]|nr:hypothetical protein [Crocinitomicaceae bacterium]
MANNRVYYAIQQVTFGKDSNGSGGTRTAAHGVQSIGITTNFNLEQVFELGQISIYENVEGTPDVEVTMSKVLDGYIPLYCLATADQTNGPALSQRVDSDVKTFVQLGIWDEANQSAGENSSTAGSWVEMSGLVVSSVSYNFPLDDNFSEDITLVGNYKVWRSGMATNTVSEDCGVSYYPTGAAGSFGGNNDTPVGSGGVNRRENIQFATQTSDTNKADFTILPEDIPGVGTSGQRGSAHVSSITVSTDVSREDIFELGAKLPYAKSVTFPVEVTCDIEVTTASGDLVNALDDCTDDAACNTKSNLNERRIRISTCEGLRIWLGQKNKLSSVSYGGGDAGGGNATVTYSYSNFNDFTVVHVNDKSANGGSTDGGTWWSSRDDYVGTGVYY